MAGKRFHKGNALIEYALPLAILIGASGLVAAVTNVPQALQTYLQNNSHAVLSQSSLKIKAFGTLEKPAPKTVAVTALSAQLQKAASLLPPPGPNEQQVCFGSGFCLNMPTINQNAIEISGGLGESQIYSMSNILQQLASQLQAAGADASLVQLVSNLANNGHSVGDYYADETAKLAAAKAICGKTICKSSDFSPDDFWTYKIETPWTQLSQLQSGWLTLQTYMQNNPNAFAGFPEAKNIIALQYQEILKLGNGVDSASSWNQHSKPVSTSGGSTTYTPQTDTYVSASSGKPVTETVYKDSDGNVTYQILTTGNTTQAYSLNDSGQLVPTTDPPPSDSSYGASTHPSAYTLNTAIKNTAEPIHQDANTICATGGNMASCYVVTPSATASAAP